MTCTIHVAFAVFDGVNFLDVSGPFEAFSLATKSSANALEPRYKVSIASPSGGLVQTSSGMLMDSLCANQLEGVDTVIIPGGGNHLAPSAPEAIIRWIQEMEPRVRRLCSVCTGAFFLAAAGCLNGRPVTTHWAAADLLRRRFPELQVDCDRIYLNDGKVWTSAGVTAGIDLALALIEDDFGFDVAMTVARYLVVYLRRPGSQAQFSKPFSLQIASDDSFSGLHAWLRENLGMKLTVERLAAIAGMSRRSFSPTLSCAGWTHTRRHHRRNADRGSTACNQPGQSHAEASRTRLRVRRRAKSPTRTSASRPAAQPPALIYAGQAMMA
ncbi:GlxA family transcriptional regulator [Plastoroseomonas hellenica]|nr:AraC family transcriptional regulator [Plastoroseomonas hellenica]MBR0642717.1 AraC family transcriptional regulator [Plastoroseomonas hellenica]